MRNGNAKQIMSLSKEHTTALWNAVQDSTCHALSHLPTLSHLIHRPPPERPVSTPLQRSCRFSSICSGAQISPYPLRLA